MGLLHLLLDVGLAVVLVKWTPIPLVLSLNFLLDIGWSHKSHPPPGRTKLLGWWVGLVLAATALLATPPLVLWFGVTHGLWVTVTVQAALCAVPLVLLLAHGVRSRLRRRKPGPGVHRTGPARGADGPEPPASAPKDTPPA
ncbi:hypothetical protein [Streptomyces sp. MAR4 CNX-425]|uniref:hypothetical protein n=1 Tax=Streptomyces sp. MAR4 CNX-425 TaxID=3406343 RepID=UPI003B50B62F